MSFGALDQTTSTGSRRAVTAFFDRREDADDAVSRLASAGFPRDQIRLVPGRGATTSSSGTSATSTGTDDGGFWDSLRDFFLPEEDRYSYAEGLNRGGYVVSVTADEARYDTALDILDDEGTVDMNARESAWRSEGWSGYSGTSASTLGAGSMAGSGGAGMTGRAGLGSEEVIPVAEEELRVGKRDVSHGRVRIRSYVVETPVSEQVSLRDEHVHVERRPVDRALGGNERLFEDRTIEMEERGEEAVVAKEARVREELVINKEVGQRTETISDTVRHTEVDVEDGRDERGIGERGIGERKFGAR